MSGSDWIVVLVAFAASLPLFLFGVPLFLFGGKWWRMNQRATDMQILWPTCCERAPDLDHAKAAFAFHVFSDGAWTTDYTHDELVKFIDDLDRV